MALPISPSATLEGSTSETFTFGSVYAGVEFTCSITGDSSGALSGVTAVSLTLDTGGLAEVWSVTAVTQTAPTPTQIVLAVNGTTFATLTGIDTTGTIAGTLSYTGSAGEYDYNVSCNGTTITGLQYSGYPGFVGFGALTFGQTGTFGKNDFDATVAQYINEAIELDPVTAVQAIPISLSGTNTGTLAAHMDGSLDAGGYVELTAFSAGTDWSGTGPGTAPGTHTFQVRDHHRTSVVSNTVTFVTPATETISLDVGQPLYAGNPALLSGLNGAPLAAAMDYVVDGGSPAAVTSFVEGASWTGVGPTEPVGQHVIHVYDTATSVQSNTVTYQVLAAILLNPITAEAGVPPPIGGTDFEGTPATSMDYQLNGTGSWITVPSFVGAGMTGDAWTGLGPAEPVGTYTLQVRNTNNTSIVSNIVTYVIGAGAPVCVVPPAQPNLGRYRGAVGLNWNGMTLIGDAFSGVVGQADFDNFTEYGNTMLGLITTPPLQDDRLRVFVSRFELDVESGIGAPDCCGANPNWMLDWSKDGGRTFGPQQLLRSAGRIGAYLQRLRWLRLGQARQWIFRLQCTDPVRRVIIGVSVDSHSGMR